MKTKQAGTGQHAWWEGIGIIDGDVPGSLKDFGVSFMERGKIAIGTGGPDKTVRSRRSVNDDKWHHIVVTRDSVKGHLLIYLDGMLNFGGAGNPGTLDAPPRLTVGALQTGNNFY